MKKRQMIKIDEEKCDGCGLCIDACSEGALALVDGKAKLIKENHCDGLGDCLPACPRDAIKLEYREAPAFVNPLLEQNVACDCNTVPTMIPFDDDGPKDSELSQWPVQINLVPVKAPWFDGSDLLIAADCTAYSIKNFHDRFIKGKITLIGCPKLDPVDYSEKLSEILKNNDIKTITLVRMDVPCCSGMYNAVNKAIEKSGKDVPLTTYIISRKGQVLCAN
jgi:ferredoxin